MQQKSVNKASCWGKTGGSLETRRRTSKVENLLLSFGKGLKQFIDWQLITTTTNVRFTYPCRSKKGRPEVSALEQYSQIDNLLQRLH